MVPSELRPGLQDLEPWLAVLTILVVVLVTGGIPVTATMSWGRSVSMYLPCLLRLKVRALVASRMAR